MIILDALRFIVVVEMIVIVAVTLRIMSIYAFLNNYFPKERRLLPQHVVFISIGHTAFAVAMAGAVVERLGEGGVSWYLSPLGLIAGTSSLYALWLMLRHEERELHRVQALLRARDDLV